MNKLITFGDSWMKGVGVEYQDGMTEDQYFDVKSKESQNCFRNLLSTRLNLQNINYSRGGSSNQRQFRKALDTFFGGDSIKTDKGDIVLWGITSVYRTELWNTKNQDFECIQLQGSGGSISKILTMNHHDEKQELKILGHQMQLWNAYFKSINVRNFWFNIFNDHTWDHNVDNFLFDGSSLLSYLIDDFSPNDRYHKSVWIDNDKKIQKAKQMNLVNPFTGHPTKLGHKRLAELLEGKIK